MAGYFFPGRGTADGYALQSLGVSAWARRGRRLNQIAFSALMQSTAAQNFGQKKLALAGRGGRCAAVAGGLWRMATANRWTLFHHGISSFPRGIPYSILICRYRCRRRGVPRRHKESRDPVSSDAKSAFYPILDCNPFCWPGNR